MKKMRLFLGIWIAFLHISCKVIKPECSLTDITCSPIAQIFYHDMVTEKTKSPDGINGLTAWYKADAITATEGTPVSIWPNSGPNGYDIVNNMGSPECNTSPLYRESGPAGKLALEFVNSTDCFHYSAPVKADSLVAEDLSTTFILLQDRDNTTDGAIFGWYYTATSPPTDIFGVFLSQYSISFVQNKSPAISFDMIYQPPGDWYSKYWLISIRKNNTTNTLYLDTVQKYSRTSSYTPIDMTLDGAIIVAPANGTLSFFGKISEIAVFNRSLPEDEIKSIHRYFGTKYNIETDYVCL